MNAIPPTTPTQKLCTRCKQTKVLEKFYKGHASHGRMSWCKTCSNAYKVAEHKKNPEKSRQRDTTRLASPVGRAGNIYRAAKRRALLKNILFNVSLARIEVALLLGKCERTAIPFDLSKPNKLSRNPYSPSIDRIDPFKGYTDDNVQIVVGMYNLGKSQYSDSEFIAFCKIVADHYK